MARLRKGRQPRLASGRHDGDPADEGGETAWLIFGVNPVLEKLRASPGTVFKLLVVPTRRAGARKAARVAEALGMPICEVTQGELDRLTRGGNHQGVALQVKPYRYAVYDQLLRDTPSLILFLDQLADPQNLGAILRSAEAFGVGGVVLPQDRAAHLSPAVARTAAGALEYLKICRVVNLGRALEQAKERDYWVIGLDPSGERSIRDLPLLERLALVVGGEAHGLREGTRRRCDFLARIQTVGQVGSLNAGVAAAVALFWFGLSLRLAPRR